MLPTDLDECKAKEAVCVHPALCDNTYGGYRCICNGTTEVDKTQSCILGKDLSIFYFIYLFFLLFESQSQSINYHVSVCGGFALTMTEREQMSSPELDLILGLVLGLGLPLLLLLLIALAYFCCRKKTVSGE